MYSSLAPTLSVPASADIRLQSDRLVAAAQSVYDDWQQDADGFDIELGEGGICHLIADAFSGALGEMGVQDSLSLQASVGENHVFVVALLADGVFSIDIPASVYETGGGYSWRKRAGVILGADDLVISRISDPVSSDIFQDLYGGE